MKTLILYFSQTGNTKKIADRIAEGIIASGSECDLADMLKAGGKDLAVYDLIGIGCPVFFYREPINVRRFIEGLPHVHNKPCFIFCTHGCVMGNTLYYLSEKMKSRGYRVAGYHDAYAASSLRFYPPVMHTDGHPDDIELDDAYLFGRSICGEARLHTDAGSGLGLIEGTWWSDSMKILIPALLRKISPKFTINQDRCTKCLLCQKNCPVGAIDIERNPQVIQGESCIFCWYCEKLCPEKAIEADWSRMIKGSKDNLKKYTEEIRKAVAEGSFRPYVDYEKIGGPS